MVALVPRAFIYWMTGVRGWAETSSTPSFCQKLKVLNTLMLEPFDVFAIHACHDTLGAHDLLSFGIVETYIEHGEECCDVVVSCDAIL